MTSLKMLLAGAVCYIPEYLDPLVCIRDPVCILFKIRLIFKVFTVSEARRTDCNYVA